MLVIGSGGCKRIAKCRIRRSTHIFRTTWSIRIGTRSVCIIIVSPWRRSSRRRRVVLSTVWCSSRHWRGSNLRIVLCWHSAWWRRELTGLRIEALLRSIGIWGGSVWSPGIVAVLVGIMGSVGSRFFFLACTNQSVPFPYFVGYTYVFVLCVPSFPPYVGYIHWCRSRLQQQPRRI